MSPTLFVTFFALVAAYFVLFYVWRGIYNYFFSPLKKVPGPWLARFTRLREVYENITPGYHPRLIELHRKYGPVVRLGPNYYSFNRGEDMRTIYNLTTKWVKSDWYNVAGPPDIPPSIFSTKDEHEHSLRKRKIGNLYSMSTMVSYEPAVDRSTEVCVRKLGEVAERNDAGHFNLPDFLQCFAFDVVSEITFDKKYNLMEHGGDPDGMLLGIRRTLYTLAIVGVVPAFYPYLWKVITLIQHFTEASGLIKIAQSIRERAIYFREKSDPRESVTSKSEPFLAKLVSLESAGKLDVNSILDSCLANLVAGSDTTGIALAAAVWYIYHHPAVLSRLRAEIEAVGPEPITFAQAQNMPYMDAVIKETLRIHPPIGNLFPRVVPKEGAQLAGYAFPPGTHVGVSPWALHYNPDVSGPDAAVFRPERWLDGPEGDNLDSITRGNMSFSFGGGTRPCIGKNISMLEITKVLPQIVRSFDFEFMQTEWRLETAGMAWPHYTCRVRRAAKE